MTVEIYIPTMGRVGPTRQVTLMEFLNKSKYRPILVCPENELARHKKYYDRVVRCDAKGIGPTRQWILENSTSDIVIMADDDMKFQKRVKPTEPKLEQCESGDLNFMVGNCLGMIMTGFIHGGISARQGNNHTKTATATCKRNCNFHVLNREEVIRHGARFDQLPVMEDFHFILTLLTQGYPNCVDYTFCWNQIPGSIGGCNTYRTLEMQEEAAKGLKKAFPEFVTVVKKNSKTGWSIAKGERYDVRVQWKKAFESHQ